MQDFSLDSVVDSLAEDILSVSDRGRSAIFGASGEAMLVLLGEVERRTSQQWTFPKARLALDVIFRFVTGLSGPDEYPDLRRDLLRSGPHGHDLDSPWSTYAQDVITCIDAALVASSVSGEEEFQPNWIQFALEPLVVSLAARGYDVEFEPVPPGGSPLQAELDVAVEFLRSALQSVSSAGHIGESEYRSMIRNAKVLVPPFR